MSKYASDLINNIKPYVPGEQPRDRSYIKLNTNENPFNPSQNAVDSITRQSIENLRRYNDPTAKSATEAVAKNLVLNYDNVLLTNGSDEALAFAFMCYGKSGIVTPDVTYGFYENIARLLNVDYKIIALKDNFTINPPDYFNSGKTVVIANPNAQTGIALSLDEIEKIIQNNSRNIVLIDQAYADFSEVDAIPLINTYSNLLIIGTFSKSRSLAGARIGYAAANSEIIEDLNKVKFSFNPYNVNSISQLLAENSANDREYFNERVKQVKILRSNLSQKLIEAGFEVLPSSSNFIAARCKNHGGHELYLKLKERGILVRHFSDERISDFIRITVGTAEENQTLITALTKIIEEPK